MVSSPKAYAALIQSLQHSVGDYPHNCYDPEWDNWHLRDVVEQGCLLVLTQMVDRFGVEGLVKSKFVERWLAKEPWSANEDERQLNFMDCLRKPYRLTPLLLPLFNGGKGRKQLVEADLLPAEAAEEDDSLVPNYTRMTNIVGAEMLSRRPRDQSREEEHLRRRHREAMVLNDGTRPLERGDIIERER